MKKTKSFLFYLVCGIVFFYSFTHEKEYPFKLKQGQIYNIIEVVNQSNAPHLQVVQAQKDLGEALKPFIDSTGRLK